MAKLHALHNTALFVSGLLDVTKEVRFSMLMRGELVLDSRTPANSK